MSGGSSVKIVIILLYLRPGRAPGSEGGILAVGSDAGFELDNLDVEIVKTFAKTLSLSIGRKPALCTVGQQKKRSG